MNEITDVKNQRAVQALMSQEQVELIKRTVAKGATDDELQMFLHLAQAYNLDPFAKEIWFIKYDKSNPTIMTSRDGYLKIAQSSSEYEGLVAFAVCEGDTFEIDAINYTVTHKFGAKRGKILGAWARCDRFGRKPQITFAPFDEYDQGTATWKRYKSAMIIKVAETFVLKRQFGINGLVTKEEMPEEYDLKNVTDSSHKPAALPAGGETQQFPQEVGDYEVSINGGPRTKLCEMTMKQLKWLQEKSSNETIRAMTSAYIDEIEFKGKEIDAETPGAAEHNLQVSESSPDAAQETDSPAALFGGAAL